MLSRLSCLLSEKDKALSSTLISALVITRERRIIRVIGLSSKPKKLSSYIGIQAIYPESSLLASTLSDAI